MSVQTSHKTTTRTYRTVNVASPEPVTNTITIAGGSVSPVSPVSPMSPVSSVSQVATLPYAINGSYETVRYLVPMQQPMQQQYVLMQQPMIQQPMMQQVVSPMYLQSVPRLSVSSVDSDVMYQQHSTMEVSPAFSCQGARIT